MTSTRTIRDVGGGAPSDHKSISSIVAFAADNGDGLAPCWSQCCSSMPDHTRPGPLHQRGRWDMSLDDGSAVECLHLCSGDDLNRSTCVGIIPMRNRVSAGRKEISCQRCNVMTKANRRSQWRNAAGRSASDQPSKAFISFTAWTRPTRTARAMILWPMLYSTISGI